MSPSDEEPTARASARRFKFTLPSQFRRLLRAVHRDAGYLAIGLTFVYAASGLSVNHIADWDPNYRQIKETHPLPSDLELSVAPGDAGQNETAARKVLHVLGIDEEPTDIYAGAPDELDITLEHADVHVDLKARTISQNGQSERFLLKTANFLHLNRGKRAWTFIADSYAVLLLVLASSGLFMVKGQKGVLGRGGIFVAIGAAVPVLYVVLSGR